MVAVVDDVDLLCYGVVSGDDELAVIFGLFGCVGNALHLSHRFELKNLEIVAVFGQLVDAAPQE